MVQMGHNEPLLPVSECPAGKVIYGAVVTCKGCGKQVLITDKGLRQQHRWWEQIGWGRVSATARGQRLDGYLYCPECYPAAHQESVGV